VKFPYRLLAFIMAFVLSVAASSAAESKEKEHDGKKVDSGSFGVFQNGHRVGTETFSIYETGGGSVIDSEFKTENSPTVAIQTSEMRLTTTGDIKRYEWKEVSPGKAESVVLPNDDFLMQKWSAGPQEKEHEQPYLLSPQTNILDDYFFVHREVLAWKFLGMICKQDKGGLACQPKQRTRFMTLNPHQQSSASLGAEFLGREKMTIKGSQLDLLKIEFKNDTATWQLWLDDRDSQFKVLRMLVVGENTIVDRD
jgi:hypothetical protein